MQSTENKKDIYDRISSNLLFKISFAAIAIIGCAVTVYAAFFQEKSIQIQYVITANSNVLDINTEISKLDIVYDSISLKQRKENLRIYNIKIINNGNTDILKTFFDENEPLGISIQDGEIVEKPEVTETSSPYIQKNLKTFLRGQNKVEFSRIILERQEYFSIKILVLHQNKLTPQLMPIGKIAGQKQIKLINASEVEIEKPFFVETFGGNIWVQFVRFVAYIISIVTVLFLIFIISDKLDDIKTSAKRKKNIKDFKESKDYSHNKMNDAIFTRYKNFGERYFLRMSNLLHSEDFLTKAHKKSIEKVKKERKVISSSNYTSRTIIWQEDSNDLGIINSMIHDGLVIQEGNKLIINQHMRSCLNKFIDFLKERDHFSNAKFYW